MSMTVEKLIELSNNSPVVNTQKLNPEIDVTTGEAFTINSGYKSNLAKFGQKDLDNPTAIYLYPKSFEDKEKIVDILNRKCKENNRKDFPVYQAQYDKSGNYIEKVLFMTLPYDE